MPDTARPSGVQQQQSSLLGAVRREQRERHAIGGYRGPQVCNIVGVTYRQLDYWARSDLVRPSLSEAHGSGTVRRYSRHDLIELAVIKALLDAGISLQRVRPAIAHLRQHLDGDLTTANLVLTGSDAFIAHDGTTIRQLLHTSGGVLNILPLADLLAGIDAATNIDQPAHQPTENTA